MLVDMNLHVNDVHKTLPKLKCTARAHGFAVAQTGAAYRPSAWLPKAVCGANGMCLRMGPSAATGNHVSQSDPPFSSYVCSCWWFCLRVGCTMLQLPSRKMAALCCLVGLQAPISMVANSRTLASPRGRKCLRGGPAAMLRGVAGDSRLAPLSAAWPREAAGLVFDQQLCVATMKTPWLFLLVCKSPDSQLVIWIGLEASWFPNCKSGLKPASQSKPPIQDYLQT